MADDLKAPKGYSVLTADDHFVGIWRDRETAEKVVNRSPSAKGERIVEYVPVTALRAKDAEDAARLAEIREIYAGMEGFVPQTAAEGYCLEIIRKMAHAAMGGAEHG